MHVAIVALMCTLLCKCLKAQTSSPRPYQVNRAITCNARPLDPFSFPSGHAFHAVAFTAIASAYYRQLFWFLIPFTFPYCLAARGAGFALSERRACGNCHPRHNYRRSSSERVCSRRANFPVSPSVMDARRLYCDNGGRVARRALVTIAAAIPSKEQFLKKSYTFSRNIVESLA